MEDHRTVPLDWGVIGIRDFDGDVRAGILWRRTSTGNHSIYFMNGLTVTSEGFIPSVPVPGQVMSR